MVKKKKAKMERCNVRSGDGRCLQVVILENFKIK